MTHDSVKFPEEQQIIKLVDDAVTRIEQLEAALKKQYNRGPELRLDPPDKRNSPDSPFVRIEQLNKSIEIQKSNTLKKTFELADSLPSDNKKALINYAFDELYPEVMAKEVQQQKKENLTDHFKDAAAKNEKPVDTAKRIPIRSQFIEQGEKVPIVSQFIGEEKRVPLQSMFFDMPSTNLANDKKPEKDIENDKDVEPPEQ